MGKVFVNFIQALKSLTYDFAWRQLKAKLVTIM